MSQLNAAFEQIQNKHPALSKVMAFQFRHSSDWDRFGHLGLLLSHQYDWIDLTLQSAEEASKQSKTNDPADELTVYAANVHRWSSHQWSAINLLQQGHYGECYAIGRLNLETVDLITLLASAPDTIADWMESTKTPEKIPPRKWQPVGIRERLEKIDARSYDQSAYSYASAAIHPSSWGNTMYASRILGSDNDYSLTWGIIFDPDRILGILRMFLHAAPIPLWQFMRIVERRKLPGRVRDLFADHYAEMFTMWSFMVEYTSKLRELLMEWESERNDSRQPDWGDADFTEKVEAMRKAVFENELMK